MTARRPAYPPREWIAMHEVCRNDGARIRISVAYREDGPALSIAHIVNGHVHNPTTFRGDDLVAFARIINQLTTESA